MVLGWWWWWWYLNRTDGNASLVESNFYNRTDDCRPQTNNGFEIFWTQNNWPGEGEGGVRGNKILWTKDSPGADMNILIWRFTNKHQEETDPYLLLAGIILVKIRVVPIQQNRNTTKSMALAWRTWVSMDHSLRRFSDRKANTSRHCGVF